MLKDTIISEPPLEFKRRYALSAEELFRAWTYPELLKEWFAPDASFDIPVAEVHLREGGRYRIDMRSPDGSLSFSVSGVYKEVTPPSRLVFTWAWSSQPQLESLVTVEIKGDNDSSELTLTHEGLASEEERVKHVHGWNLDLERLNDLRDYTQRTRINAPRDRVYDAIATLPGLAAWWTPEVTGSPETGGELRFGFGGYDKLVMQVDAATRPLAVRWTCTYHRTDEGEEGEWIGTHVSFDLFERAAGECELSFRHHGLTRKLECYDDCERGWDHFLQSLVRYVERGKGTPFGS